MIGAQVSGYPLAVGETVFIVLDGAVRRARIAWLMVSATGLKIEVQFRNGNVHVASPEMVFSSPVGACNHAFGGEPEPPL